jgi:hypothetical protein
LLSFAAQAFISLVLSIWVFFLSKIGRLAVKHRLGTRDHEIELERLKIVSKIVLTGNHAQLLTGK